VRLFQNFSFGTTTLDLIEKGGYSPRANSFNFHVPTNYQVLEEFLAAKSKKSNKFPYKVSFSLPCFDFFDFAVIFFFKACYFKGNFDAEKSK
jgi:hypothetical protein